MQVGSLGQEDPLEEGMPTDSIILVQRIPWTEEPSGFQPIQLQNQTRLKRLNTHTQYLPHLFAHIYEGIIHINKEKYMNPM